MSDVFAEFMDHDDTTPEQDDDMLSGEEDEEESGGEEEDDRRHEAEALETLGSQGSKLEGAGRGADRYATTEEEEVAEAGIDTEEDAHTCMRSLQDLAKVFQKFASDPTEANEARIFQGAAPSTQRDLEEFFRDAHNGVVHSIQWLKSMHSSGVYGESPEALEEHKQQILRLLQIVQSLCVLRLTARRQMHDRSFDVVAGMRAAAHGLVKASESDEAATDMSTEALDIILDWCAQNGAVKNHNGDLFFQVHCGTRALPVYEDSEKEEHKNIKRVVAYLCSPAVIPRLGEIDSFNHGVVPWLEKKLSGITDPRLPWYKPDPMLYLFGDRLVIDIDKRRAYDIEVHQPLLKGKQVYHWLRGSDVRPDDVQKSWEQIETPAFDTVLRTQGIVDDPIMEASIRDSEEAHMQLDLEEEEVVRYLGALDTRKRLEGLVGILDSRRKRKQRHMPDLRPGKDYIKTPEYIVAAADPQDPIAQAEQETAALEDVTLAWTTTEFDAVEARFRDRIGRGKSQELKARDTLIESGDLPDPMCPFCKHWCSWTNVGRAPAADLAEWFPNEVRHDKTGWIEGKEPWRHFACECIEYPKQARCFFATVFGRMHWPLGKDRWGVMPFIRGLPGTGKSAGLEALAKSLPTGAMGVIPSAVNPLFALGTMKDALCIVYPEITANFTLPKGTFLDMCTRGRVQIERKNVQAEAVQAKWPQLGVGNEFPYQWMDLIGNIVRRLVLFEYLRLPKHMDPDLEEAVQAESAKLMIKGVLAYHEMLDECHRAPLGVVMGLIVKINQWKLKTDLDPFYSWLTNSDGVGMRIGPEYRTPITVLLRMFREWWKDNRQGRCPELNETLYVGTFHARGFKWVCGESASFLPECGAFMARTDWVVGVDFNVDMYRDKLGDIYGECGFRDIGEWLDGRQGAAMGGGGEPEAMDAGGFGM